MSRYIRFEPVPRVSVIYSAGVGTGADLRGGSAGFGMASLSRNCSGTVDRAVRQVFSLQSEV